MKHRHRALNSPREAPPAIAESSRREIRLLVLSIILLFTRALSAFEPDAPELEIERLGTQALLSWSPVEDAAAYRVYGGATPGQMDFLVETPDTLYLVPLEGPERFFQVRAWALDPLPEERYLLADQFGYHPGSRKTALLADPQTGYNSADSYLPGPVIELRRVADGVVMHSASPLPWQAGVEDTVSGDRVWRFDFSQVQETGLYQVHDPQSGRASTPFRICDSVYEEVLRHAGRSYYYQRCGHAKAVPFADARWIDDACHLGAQQDLDCRLVSDPQPSTSRDLSGGWHDAGDYNKYVNYTDDALHDLLLALEDQPGVWPDDWGIPESGNGRPDLLDELTCEFQWLRKMQFEDGSVSHKMGATEWGSASPPSDDTMLRRYAPATASATIAACGAFAHGAIVYDTQPDSTSQSFASELESAALAAWSWLEANPEEIPSAYDNAGFVNAGAEDGANWQAVNRVSAAGYLFHLTGDTQYRDFFDSGYGEAYLIQWWWLSPFQAQFQDALLYYTRSPFATPAVAQDIIDHYLVGAQDYLDGLLQDTAAYLVYILADEYTWGSNKCVCQLGNIFTSLVDYGLDPPNEALYRQAAAEHLRYIHGVNPNGLVYLSHMDESGAERSVTQFYHQWFCDGSIWDSSVESLYGPAPGFLTGGPNMYYEPDPEYGGPPIEPPQNQPPQKSYLDWNADWPENSYEVTENHIPYQAAYLRLLAWVMEHGE